MKLLLATLSIVLMLPAVVAAETRLWMAEEAGCFWCARWNSEISEIYPKTAEGRAAPLQRFDIHGDKPEGVTFKSRVSFTPTFVLVADGIEVGRIEGYPGEDFFWALLGKMLQKADIPFDEAG